MRIDATRYRLFWTNPEEFRLRELWKIVPDGSGAPSFITFGRRRGSAFHDLTDGNTPNEKLGESAIKTAETMHEANQRYGRDTKVLWREREFDIEIPDSPHRMVGRVDSMVERYGEVFVEDYKTTCNRTKLEMERYRDGLSQGPQVDFYLCAHPESEKLVYRILWKQPKKSGPVINISELTCRRTKWQLAAFQRSVHMTCCTIESWVKEFGIEKPWPRSICLPVSPLLYSYKDDVYGRSIYTTEGLEGYRPKVEHLECLRGVPSEPSV